MVAAQTGRGEGGMIRVAHVADIHLGARLRHLPDCPDIDPTEAAYDAFAALLHRLLSERYDAILCAGDLFDRDAGTPRALRTAQSALNDLHEAGIPVALIWGNHDAESPLPHQLRLPQSAWLAPVDTPATCRWHDIGIAVHAQSIGDRDETRDLAAIYPAPIPYWTNIGMLHTSLTGEHSRRVCAPTTLATLTARGYDYWALGHVHQRSALAHDPPVAYPGSAHPAKKTEFGTRGFLEIRFTAGAVTLYPVDTAPLVREILTATAEQDVRNQFAAYQSRGRTVVWTLHGPAQLLEPARTAAREHPGFVVVPA
jgi:DNA repair exonuclease SbcCD nuclease subunit